MKTMDRTTMERATVSLPHDVVIRLRAMAKRRHMSMAAIIREAVEDKTRYEEVEEKPRKRRRFQSMGIVDSGYTDTSILASQGPVPPVSWR